MICFQACVHQGLQCLRQALEMPAREIATERGLHFKAHRHRIQGELQCCSVFYQFITQVSALIELSFTRLKLCVFRTRTLRKKSVPVPAFRKMYFPSPDENIREYSLFNFHRREIFSIRRPQEKTEDCIKQGRPRGEKRTSRPSGHSFTRTHIILRPSFIANSSGK